VKQDVIAAFRVLNDEQPERQAERLPANKHAPQLASNYWFTAK